MKNRSIAKTIELFIGQIIIRLTKFFLRSSLIFLLVILTVSLLELLAYWGNGDKEPLFYNNALLKEEEDEFFRDYHFSLDPLLGWGIDSLKIKGARMKNNCIYLENLEGSSEDTIVILITGGSAADIIYQNYNWPVGLFNQFKQEGIKCKMYVGAVAGYNTNQELLKSLIDGLGIDNIDYHISYFGVNENSGQGYITEYEYAIYKDVLNGEKKSPILPNIFAFMRNLIYNDTEVNLASNRHSNQNATIANLKIMRSISRDNNFQFIPILQPSLGVGSSENDFTRFNLKDSSDAEGLLGAMELHQESYRMFYEAVDSIDFVYYDFTNIFQNVDVYPFIDDCHVKEKYQYLVSNKIYDIIMGKR